MAVIILPMHEDDIGAVAKIHRQQFPRQKDSTRWVGCNFAAFPRVTIFVARDERDKVVGYIQWIQKSGFRKQPVIELEQIAVLENQQGKGIGRLLIKQSLEQIKDYLAGINSHLKAILISTRTDNIARALYEKALNTQEVAVIKDLYSHDEVILIARDV